MKFLNIFLTLIFIIFLGNLQAQNLDTNPHQTFTDLLQKYVSADGRVDYKGLSRDENQLDKYLTELATNIPTENADLELAYWINVYNAYTLKLIVEESKKKNIQSIMDIDQGDVWNRKWIKLEDKLYSLNNIENDIIRVKFNEPRIHFAVNCAAKSCPPLLNEAYTANELDKQLEEQTKKFINNPQYNQLTEREMMVSKIFEWYAADFGDLKSFISRYSNIDLRKASVRYQEYDWSLNK